MLRYATVITSKSGIFVRKPYPAARTDFPPTAYVVLTREVGFGRRKFRG
jgi:hypothetical protein